MWARAEVLGGLWGSGDNGGRADEDDLRSMSDDGDAGTFGMPCSGWEPDWKAVPERKLRDAGWRWGRGTTT